MRAGLEAQVSELRAKIQDAQDRLEAAREGALPKSEYLANVSAWIDTQAAEFEKGLEYSVSALRMPGPTMERPTFGQVPIRGGLAHEAVAVADVSGLICWLAGHAIKDRLAKVIEASPYQEGPPAKERTRLVNLIEAELDELELSEERLIVELEEIGLQLPRRPDCRPEIVLSPWLAEAA